MSRPAHLSNAACPHSRRASREAALRQLSSYLMLVPLAASPRSTRVHRIGLVIEMKRSLSICPDKIEPHAYMCHVLDGPKIPSDIHNEPPTPLLKRGQGEVPCFVIKFENDSSRARNAELLKHTCDGLGLVFKPVLNRVPTVALELVQQSEDDYSPLRRLA